MNDSDQVEADITRQEQQAEAELAERHAYLNLLAQLNHPDYTPARERMDQWGSYLEEQLHE